MCHFRTKVVFALNIVISALLFASFFVYPARILAVEPLDKEAPHVLVVFSSKNSEIDEHQRMLDMLLGHFTNHITFKASSQVEEKDLAQAAYLFYYGQEREALPQKFLRMIPDFTGIMVAVGYNVEQLGGRFSFIDLLPTEVVIDQIDLAHHPDKHFSFIPHLIFNMTLTEEQQTKTLLVGKKEKEEYPLFVKSNNSYYFAAHILKPPFSIAFAEGLHEVFGTEYEMMSPGYIRLEDIHPLVDPENLMAIAEILKEKNIPYMVAVIPVYTNPETGRQYHFSDSPKLLKVLKYMQDHGGSIVLHGYTHQFRLSETGEGFEFWDVEYNMPIYHDQDDEVIVLTRDDFESEAEYEQYLAQQQAFERNYIEQRITSGIQELANYGLYPLAFEPPHYTMSQHGYQVISEFFTTYVGHLQLSDGNWEIMTTVPYLTKPTFLHGMLLLPETMGYVDPEEPQSIEKMLNNAQDYQFVRNGMVAGFYHPYLGVDLFVELIEEMEGIPNVSWIDLKQMNNTVRVENVEIRSGKGQIIVDIKYSGLFRDSKGYLTYHIKRFIEKVMWGIAGIGSLAVVLFTITIFYTSIRNKNTERGNQVG